MPVLTTSFLESSYFICKPNVKDSTGVLFNLSKKSVLFDSLGGMYAYIINHFLLEMVSSKDIVSDLFLSNSFILFAIKPSFTKTTVPLRCLSLFLLNGQNWKPTILNFWPGKLSSSVVSSTQIISNDDFLINLS